MTRAARAGGSPAWGVLREYEDAAGARRVIADADVRAVEAAMLPEDHVEAPLFIRRGQPLPPGATSIELEDAREVGAGTKLSAAVPFGYHRLVFADGRRVR